MAVDVLIVDDEKNIRDILASVMIDEGYTARTASNSDESLAEFNKQAPSIVILDVWLNNSKMDGLEILHEFKSINPDVPIIMMSGHGTLDMAVSATKEGAYDFISKPFKTAELLSTMVRALDTVKLKTQVDSLQDKLGIGEGEIIGVSKYVEKLKKDIVKIAKSNISLICGDIGTGKEIIAQNIHKQSGVAGNFTVFDCNGEDVKNMDKQIFGTDGIIKKSSGVLIVDNLQVAGSKIQDKFVEYIKSNNDAKIIFICNDKSQVSKKLLDLFNNSIIQTKPLNDRLQDIEPLAKEFLEFKSKARRQKPKKMDKTAITALMNHNWGGNIWELLNVIDNLLISVKSDTISADDIKKCIYSNTEKQLNIGMEDILMLDLRKSRESFEKYYLLFHLKRFNGNITQTSEFVGMDRAALSRKIKSLDIKVDG